MVITKGIREVRLGDINQGMLFEHGNTIAIKSGYKNLKGGFECYIVGTGEMFWGGTTNSNDLNNLMVLPLWIKDH